MNINRIKQLMDQAGIDAEAVESLGEMPAALKFAQLIAQDCAKMLDEDSYIIPELGGYAHDILTRYGVK